MSFPASTSSDQIHARKPGLTPPARDIRHHNFLSDALVARGLVTQTAMDRALNQARDGRRYCEILVADGVISEDAIAHALADHHGVDHVDLDEFPIEREAKALVPVETARRNGALPIDVLPSGEVVVAIHDPGLTNLVEIADLTKSPIQAVIASKTQIERHIGAPPRPTAIQPAPPAAPPPRPAAIQPAPPLTPFQPPAPPRPVEPPRGSAPLRVEAPTQQLPPAPAPPQPAAPAPERDAGQYLTARLEKAEREAAEAAERARQAERRAAGMVAAAQAANDALAQVAQARAVADDAARASTAVVDSLTAELNRVRAELEAEREGRRRAEAELHALRPTRPRAELDPRAIALPQAPVAPRLPSPAPVAPPPSSSPPGAAPTTVESSKKRGLRRMIAALKRS